MRPIVSLYVKMLRELEYTTFKQCKNRITKDELCMFQIRPEHHNWKFVHQALKHIQQTDSKTALEREKFIRDATLTEFLDCQRQRSQKTEPLRPSSSQW